MEGVDAAARDHQGGVKSGEEAWKRLVAKHVYWSIYFDVNYIIIMGGCLLYLFHVIAQLRNEWYVLIGNSDQSKRGFKLKP